MEYHFRFQNILKNCWSLQMSRQVCCTVTESHLSLNKIKSCKNLRNTPLLPLVQLYTEPRLHFKRDWALFWFCFPSPTMQALWEGLGRSWGWRWGSVLVPEGSPTSGGIWTLFRSPAPFQGAYAGTTVRQPKLEGINLSCNFLRWRAIREGFFAFCQLTLFVGKKELPIPGACLLFCWVITLQETVRGCSPAMNSRHTGAYPHLPQIIGMTPKYRYDPFTYVNSHTQSPSLAGCPQHQLSPCTGLRVALVSIT